MNEFNGPKVATFFGEPQKKPEAAMKKSGGLLFENEKVEILNKAISKQNSYVS